MYLDIRNYLQLGSVFDNDNFDTLLFMCNLNELISIYVYVYARPLMLKGILKQFSLNELASRKLFKEAKQVQ